MMPLGRFSPGRALGASLKKFPSAVLTTVQSHRENGLLLTPKEDSGRIILQLQKFRVSFQIPFNKSEWQNSKGKEDGSSKIHTRTHRVQIYYPDV